MTGRIFDDEYRTRRILDNSFSRATEQQTFETPITVGTDHNEIGTHLLGLGHNLFVGIPKTQPRLSLQPFASNFFSKQRELCIGLTRSRFHMDLNLLMFDVESLIKRCGIVWYLKHMQYLDAGTRKSGQLRRISYRLFGMLREIDRHQ